MSRIVPKLNLNKTPQLVEPNSLVMAKNIRLLEDGTIGPDTSLVIAESILCKVDEALKERGIVNGFRYIDDYFLGFKTLSEAESAIAVLQEQLNVYELALNSSKTEIIVLPHEFEDLSISELRNFSFKDANNNQRADLIYYFNKVFTVAKSSPEESIIKYAVM